MGLKIPRAEQLRLREHQLFLALTIVVGVMAGLSAVLFTLGIDAIARFGFGLDPSTARIFLIPVTVSLLTGVLLAKVFPNVRGSGVPQTKAAFHLHSGYIPLRVPIGKFLTGVLCIGSGHSIGREGPSVQIGAGIASFVGRWSGLPAQRVKDLVPVGAAGALAAAFNTPVSAVLFALEEIIGDLNAALLGSTVVASVASVVVARAILGNEPLFHVPAYHLVHPGELLAYVVLGVTGGLLSVVFCRGLLGLRRAFLQLPVFSRVFQPAIGGVIVGALLIAVPQVMGVGYEYVDQALNGGLLFRTMAILCVAKIAATIVSYSSGNAGGIFAPSLYIGAMAGGAIGMLVQRFAPFPTADPGAYALVGMGALFAGIIRAPMTSVFMIFEITQDYQILVPLMVANMLSLEISRRLQRTPVYHALLEQDRVHLPKLHGPVPTGLRAADVMNRSYVMVSPDRSVQEVWNESGSLDSGYLIGHDNRLLGVVPAPRMADALESQPDARIDSILHREPIHAHPDHTLDVVLERTLESGGLLPIVSRDDATRVLGVVTMADITRRMRSGRESAAQRL
jgi:CIC family chloride channel protein